MHDIGIKFIDVIERVKVNYFQNCFNVFTGGKNCLENIISDVLRQLI